MPKSAIELLRYAPAYCLVGILALSLDIVRTEWFGLLILSAFIGLYAFFKFDKNETYNYQHDAADDCYFIGFIYTLAVITASLVADTDALFGTGDSAGDVSQLLKTIGIALGTSVIGMMCRFVLKPKSGDLKDQFDQEVDRAATAARRLAEQVSKSQKSITSIEKSLEKAATSIQVYSDKVDEKAKEISESMDAIEEDKWKEINSILQAFFENMENFNEALKGRANKQSEEVQEIERNIQHLRGMRAEFMKAIHSDTEDITRIKQEYQQAFDQAAQDALKETHQLYSKLIVGATAALGGIEDLGKMSKDLRTIARDIERGKNETNSRSKSLFRSIFQRIKPRKDTE